MICRCRRLLPPNGHFWAIPGRFNDRRRPKLGARTPHSFHHLASPSLSSIRGCTWMKWRRARRKNSWQALTGRLSSAWVPLASRCYLQRPAQPEIRGDFFGMPRTIPPVPHSNMRSRARNHVLPGGARVDDTARCQGLHHEPAEGRAGSRGVETSMVGSLIGPTEDRDGPMHACIRSLTLPRATGLPLERLNSELKIRRSDSDPTQMTSSRS